MNRDAIRKQFEAGQITWQQTLELLKKAPKPWHTAQWKKRRAEVLGEYCQECGGQKPPMVIQHRWHPALFSDLCEAVKPMLREEYAVHNPFIAPAIQPFDPASVASPGLEERDCCPTCQSVAVKYRKRSNDWVCAGKSGRKICGSVFPQPQKRLWSKWTHEELIEMARRHHNRLIQKAQMDWEKCFLEAFSDRICHDATLLSFKQHDRYMEMRDSDVITLCKSCAFKEDAVYVDYPGQLGKEIGRSNESMRLWREELLAQLPQD